MCEVGSALGVGTASRVEPYAVPMVPDVDEPVLAESEEDPDRWKDEFGRTWLRCGLFLGRWYLLGTGLDVDLVWEEPIHILSRKPVSETQQQQLKFPIESSPFCCVTFCETSCGRPIVLHTPRAPRGGEQSDASVYTCGMHG